MLFLVYALMLAVGTKVAVKDVPEMLDEKILQKKRALALLHAIPEKDREGGVLLQGQPLYMTKHHAGKLDECTNDCMGIIEEMKRLATLVPESMTQGKKDT